MRVGHLESQERYIGIAVYRWHAKEFPAGELEAYVCTECGYYESYVRHPSDVPWNKLSGFTFLHPDTDSEGPYR